MKTYITKDELNRIFLTLQQKGWYEVYIVVRCLNELNIGFRELQKMTWDKLRIQLAHRKDVLDDLLSTRDKCRGINNDMVVQFTLRHINDRLKECQRYAKIPRDIVLSTKIFSSKIYIDSGEVYGYIKYHKKNKLEENISKYQFLYVIKHKHRDERVNNLLTDKKIGITYNLNNRSKGLTLGPIDIECLKLYKVDVSFIHKIERILHKKFNDRNVIGEWFEDHKNDIVDKIDKEINLLKLLDIDIDEIDHKELIGI